MPLPPETHTPKTILVIEDDPHGAELLQALLERAGNAVFRAADGEEGVRLAQERLPHLITVDVKLPKLDGYGVCRKLKADPRTKDIPILMVTGMTRTEDLEKGVASGVDDFISKPINRLEFLARVKSLLRVRHLKNELDRTLAYLEDLETKS